MTAISPFASSPDALRISPDQARAFIEKLAPVFDQLRTVQPLDVDSLGSGAVVAAEARAAAAGINRWIGAIQSAAGRAVQRSAALDVTIQRARQVGLPIDPLEYLRSTTAENLGDVEELTSGDAFQTTGEELEKFVEAIEKKLVATGDDAQLASIDLQNMLQKQQQTLQTMSSVSKLLHDTAMAIIRKIG